VLGDLRKFAEQHGDVVGGAIEPRLLMTHGVSGVEWTHYKHPLPEHVYDVYLQKWQQVCFKI
jgi:predicted alpha/beta-fold hydrolase